MLAWLGASVAAGAEAGSETVKTVAEDGPLKGVAARVLNEGKVIKVSPQIVASLGLIDKPDGNYTAYDENVKNGLVTEDIRVSQQRGKTEIVLGHNDTKTKILSLYLTGPAGTLDKAVQAVNGNFTELPAEQAQAGFAQAVAYWTKALPETKTGPYETTFTARSPLSEMKPLAARLQYQGELTDYDLSSETFYVYVPEKYQPKKPMGLLVLSNYKPTEGLPEPVLPQLAEANMALIVAKDLPEQWWQRAGWLLDAVYNMQQQYKIDPRRIYIFGGHEWQVGAGESPNVAERLGLNYPEVFSGTFSWGVYAFMPVPASNGNIWDAKSDIPPPGAKSLSAAKKRPLILSDGRAGEFVEDAAKAFRGAGFAHAKFVMVTTDQMHYPNYTTDWLPGVLQYMDAVTANLDVGMPGME
jgi:hypothetical protein